MHQPTTADAGGWRCASSADFPEAFLLWTLPALFLFDPDATLATSLAAALAALLTGAAFWADGRGRAESWAETLFAFGWMGVWSSAGGLLILDLGREGDLGWLWGTLCLAVGAAALAWSWNRRRRRPPEPGERPATFGADTWVWLGAGTVLLLLSLASDGPLWADAGVLGLAFVSFLLLTPRGRSASACGARW